VRRYRLELSGGWFRAYGARGRGRASAVSAYLVLPYIPAPPPYRVSYRIPLFRM